MTIKLNRPAHRGITNINIYVGHFCYLPRGTSTVRDTLPTKRWYRNLTSVSRQPSRHAVKTPSVSASLLSPGRQPPQDRDTPPTTLTPAIAHHDGKRHGQLFQIRGSAPRRRDLPLRPPIPRPPPAVPPTSSPLCKLHAHAPRVPDLANIPIHALLHNHTLRMDNRAPL